MADCTLVDEDLVVVTPLKRLVPPKVNLIVAALDELQAEGLVPALREHVERDLAADGEPEVEVGELASQPLHHGLSYTRLLVKLLKSVTLGLRAIASNRTHVDHAITELNECAPIQRVRSEMSIKKRDRLTVKASKTYLLIGMSRSAM